MLDVDHFKQINDQYGHAHGDLVLRTIADALRHTLRTADSAYRLGGDEFMVLIPHQGVIGGMQWADRFCRELATCAAPLPYQVPVTTSVGISEHTMSQATAQELQASADAQLYQAKRAGRNRIQSETRVIV